MTVPSNSLKKSLKSCCLLLLLSVAAGGCGIAVNVKPAIATPYVNDHVDCLRLTDRDPQQAYRQAQRWRVDGGGLMARHCAAIALAALDRLDEAASRLQRLATEVNDIEMARAWLAQAGQLWFLAGRLKTAETIQAEILKQEPNNPDFIVDRASTRLASGNFSGAIDDFSKALQRDPARVEALLYRAVAYRYMDALDLAHADIEQAKAIAPHRADIWLERGILRQLHGNLDRAREDFLKALSLTDDPDILEAIRGRIELMDLSRG